MSDNSKVKLLATNSLPIGHMSVMAWQLSRTEDAEESEDQILGIDAPVNEIPQLTLFITCTILEREIFTTARDHTMWARTSRVDNPLEFKYPQTIRGYGPILEDHRLQMKVMAASDDCQQDQWRMNLPLGALTSFTTSISLRSLVKIIIEFHRLADKYSHLSAQLRSTATELLGALKEAGISNPETLLGRYKPLNFFEDVKLDDKYTQLIYHRSTPNFVSVEFTAPIALRAQLVRHRTISIVDTLGSILEREDAWAVSIGTNVRIEVGASTNIWNSILRKRACWMSQRDLWSPLLPNDLPDDMLPCSNTSCPYDKDARNRYTDADPGSPCPKHAKIYNIPINTSQLKEMRRQCNQEKRPLSWQILITELERGL